MANIDIETETLKSMSNAVNAALGELNSADSILRSVVEHHDWGCKERGQINEHIQRARSDMNKIKNYGSQFNIVVAKVLGDFLETERGIGNLFSSLENIIGNVLDTWQKEGSGIGTTKTPEYLKKIGIGFFSNNNRIGTLRIADFQLLLKGMED